jgi:hypothetical protein
VRSARPDYPARLGGLWRAVRSPQVHQHAAGLGPHRDDFRAALDSPAEIGQPGGQDLLGPPLRQAALKSPRRVGAGEGHLGDGRERGIEDAREVQVHGRREEVVHKARLPENLQRAWLQRSRPRLPRRVRLALDNAGRDTEARKLDRSEQSRRPGANDQHRCPGFCDPRHDPTPRTEATWARLLPDHQGQETGRRQRAARSMQVIGGQLPACAWPVTSKPSRS